MNALCRAVFRIRFHADPARNLKAETDPGLQSSADPDSALYYTVLVILSMNVSTFYNIFVIVQGDTVHAIIFEKPEKYLYLCTKIKDPGSGSSSQNIFGSETVL